MPSNEELRALVERWQNRAAADGRKQAALIELDNGRGIYTQDAEFGRYGARSTTFDLCADELAALLPPAQPPTAYDAVPFATVAEVEDWQKQNT